MIQSLLIGRQLSCLHRSKNDLQTQLYLKMTTMKCKKQVHQQRNTKKNKDSPQEAKPSVASSSNDSPPLPISSSPTKPSLAQQDDPGKEEESSHKLLKDQQEPESSDFRRDSNLMKHSGHGSPMIRKCAATLDHSLFQEMLRTDPVVSIQCIPLRSMTTSRSSHATTQQVRH